eukprot:CAMPEP_0177616648 /NCGR_PEP_ID=MMETSP0419_2-20121207/24295_1 /TAXON_ID=582737 /ORGANISM="Tetraselmis sp., Strain GSL018" /LENGTH=204 /DNA_ID=CAMNT_0019114775 /DNA_START=199 /DNA_END=810 /DNA_ORIENTATION=+
MIPPVSSNNFALNSDSIRRGGQAVQPPSSCSGASLQVNLEPVVQGKHGLARNTSSMNHSHIFPGEGQTTSSRAAEEVNLSSLRDAVAGSKAAGDASTLHNDLKHLSTNSSFQFGEVHNASGTSNAKECALPGKADPGYFSSSKQSTLHQQGDCHGKCGAGGFRDSFASLLASNMAAPTSARPRFSNSSQNHNSRFADSHGQPQS